MQLGDDFVGKPGPGSLREAVHMGLPVISFRNAATMPQERYNTVWVEQNHLGQVISSLSDLPGATSGAVLTPPKANLQANRQAGQVSQLAIETALKFNNKLWTATLPWSAQASAFVRSKWATMWW